MPTKPFLRFLLLTFSAAIATAGDFQGNSAGALSFSMGGAFNISGDSPYAAMTQNPAALALLSGPVADLSLNVLFENGSFQNSVSSNGRLDSAGVVPYGAFGTPVGKSRFSFGVALQPEAAASSRWHYWDPPGGWNNVSYGYQLNESNILAARLAVGMGVYLGPKVSVGATFGGVYNSNTYDAPYIFQQQPILKGLKTLLDLKTHGIGWDGSVGAIAQPTRAVQVSVSYKTETSIQTHGTASGDAGEQFTAVGVPFQPDFTYRAQVNNTLPQSVLAAINWRVSSRFKLIAEEDWINWSRTFVRLPVDLTQGSNSDINGFVHSTSLQDSIPLFWHDQFISRIGFEVPLGESLRVRGGYAFSTDPVPSSTLTPLTAVIPKNNLSCGVGRGFGKYKVNLAYGIDLTASQSVGQSELLAGEYSDSRVKVRIQTAILSTSYRF